MAKGYGIAYACPKCSPLAGGFWTPEDKNPSWVIHCSECGRFPSLTKSGSMTKGEWNNLVDDMCDYVERKLERLRST